MCLEAGEEPDPAVPSLNVCDPHFRGAVGSQRRPIELLGWLGGELAAVVHWGSVDGLTVVEAQRDSNGVVDQDEWWRTDRVSLGADRQRRAQRVTVPVAVDLHRVPQPQEALVFDCGDWPGDAPTRGKRDWRQVQGAAAGGQLVNELPSPGLVIVLQRDIDT